MAEKINVEARFPFLVLDIGTGAPVTGLVTANFTITIARDNTVVALTPTVEESILGNGRYHLKFTPDLPGFYEFEIIHSTHFPNGQHQSFRAALGDETDVGVVLGLLGQHKVIDNVVTTRGKVTQYRARIFATKALADAAADGEQGNDGEASFLHTRVLDQNDADNPDLIRTTRET